MLPALDLELIRTFLTIINTGGLKHAADKLNKTPSAISMQIKRLEEQLGRRLLERNNQGVSLTEAGRTLQRYGEHLIQTNNHLLAELRNDELSGVMTFGAPTDYTPTLLRKLLPLLRVEFPKIEPRIVLEPSRTLRKRVKAGDIDVAIVAREHDSDEGQCLWREPIAWYGKNPDLQQALPIAVLSSSCIMRDTMFDSLQREQIKHQVVLETSNFASLWDAVAEQFAVALLTQLVVKDNAWQPLALPVYPKPYIEFALISAENMQSSRINTLYRRLTHIF